MDAPDSLREKVERLEAEVETVKDALPPGTKPIQINRRSFLLTVGGAATAGAAAGRVAAQSGSADGSGVAARAQIIGSGAPPDPSSEFFANKAQYHYEYLNRDNGARWVIETGDSEWTLLPIKASSADLDELNTADLANAASGEVPQAQGDGTLSMASVGGGGIWTEDGNSPQTTTGVSSDTYTLSGTFDLVLVHAFIEDVSGANNQIDFRYNGDTGTNYNYTTITNNNTTGVSEVRKLLTVGANRANTLTFLMGGRSSGEVAGGQRMNRVGASIALGWNNPAVTPPLDSMTLLGGGSFDVRWQVLGRDIASGGVP